MVAEASSANSFSSLLCACPPTDRGEFHLSGGGVSPLLSVSHSLSLFSRILVFTIHISQSHSCFLKNVGVVVRAATRSRFGRIADFAVYLEREGKNGEVDQCPLKTHQDNNGRTKENELKPTFSLLQPRLSSRPWRWRRWRGPLRPLPCRKTAAA